MTSVSDSRRPMVAGLVRVVLGSGAGGGGAGRAHPPPPGTIPHLIIPNLNPGTVLKELHLVCKMRMICSRNGSWMVGVRPPGVRQPLNRSVYCTDYGHR